MTDDSIRCIVGEKEATMPYDGKKWTLNDAANPAKYGGTR